MLLIAGDRSKKENGPAKSKCNHRTLWSWTVAEATFGIYRLIALGTGFQEKDGR